MILKINSESEFVLFETIEELNTMLQKEPVAGRDNSSRTGSQDFTGTRSFEESEDLRQYGDVDSLTKLSEVKVTTDKIFEKMEIPKVKSFNDVVGFQPIVPNALLGLPQSMVNQKRIKRDEKVITIFLNSSATWDVDKNDISFRGAIALSLVDKLEKAGYRCRLIAGTGYSYCGTIVSIYTLLKKPEHSLNLKKVAYYFVNPSHLRRTHFALRENIKEIEDCTHEGYGQSTNFMEQRNLLLEHFPKAIIIDKKSNLTPSTSNEEIIESLQKELNKIGITT